VNTICLDPVTAALLTTRRLCDTCATFAAHLPAELVRHPCGHCAPFLSFVTVDRPPPRARCDCNDYYPDLPHKVGCASLGPSPWIGQRVAIYAADVNLYPYADRMRACGITPAKVVLDAIVGSGTLAEALPIYVKGDCGMTSAPHICVWGPNELVYYGEGIEARFISDQLPLQDWSPGRWALRFTDVATRIHDRYLAIGDGPLCPVDWVSCDDSSCGFSHVTFPRPAPVLSGDDPTYKEWTP
jgi:hypothetical protein